MFLLKSVIVFCNSRDVLLTCTSFVGNTDKPRHMSRGVPTPRIPDWFGQRRSEESQSNISKPWEGIHFIWAVDRKHGQLHI